MQFTLVTLSVIEEGCFSAWLDDRGWPQFVTVERTFDGPSPVIPAGTFTCRRRMYNHGGYMTHEVTGIAGHSDILIHKGNVETESLACILAGMSFGTLSGMPAVLQSAMAFDRYWSMTKDLEEYELSVIGR